jgi:RNA polymerase sigma-70 factor (ECF subfamily)
VLHRGTSSIWSTACAYIEARDDLARALEQLSTAKRTVLLMAEVEGMTCAEIADALGIPIGTVWTRLHHARREVLAMLEDV